MAKRFAGFKPETFEKKILPALGYDGPTDMKSINLFLAANPAAAAKMGRYTLAARQMIEGPVEKAFLGKLAKGISKIFGGGSSKKSTTPAPTAEQHQAQVREMSRNIGTQDDSSSSSSSSSQPATQTTTNLKDAAVVDPAGPTNATNGTLIDVDKTQKESAGSKMTGKITKDPTAVATKAAVVAGTGTGTTIAKNTGQLGAADTAAITKAGPAGTVAQPAQLQAQKVTTTTAEPGVTQALAGLQAAEGQVDPEAQVQAAQLDPMQAAALSLKAEQTTAEQVAPTAELEVTPEQLISGPTVDMERAEEVLQKEEAASVRDELSGLMEDFEGGETPSWAAGAMRAATAQMAARGLGSSSIAGMATVQAAMEAALPIAQMDASNKQQMAMAKAEQRAAFLGQEFDQAFQTKVKNAARISEVANINFDATQQVALENARLANSVNIANLDARNAKVIADAATLSQLDMSNLNNRQQAQVTNAQSFLEMDMANLDNEQQNTMFRHQANINSIFSDQAATNAAAQFNATSENQTNQFFANLASVVSQFNAEQSNAMSRFNAGEANALAQFNASQINARDQFNAQNHLIVEQANAKWLQSVTTNENAANNQANRDATMAANQLTMTAYNNIIQQERDIMGWAWRSGENAKQRENAIVTAKIAAAADGSDGGSNAFETGLGEFAAELFSRGLDYIFPI